MRYRSPSRALRLVSPPVCQRCRAQIEGKAIADATPTRLDAYEFHAPGGMRDVALGRSCLCAPRRQVRALLRQRYRSNSRMTSVERCGSPYGGLDGSKEAAFYRRVADVHEAERSYANDAGCGRGRVDWPASSLGKRSSEPGCFLRAGPSM